jgi:DNA-cytosine methyltransferase
MRYLSVCSGLGGAELAFTPLGWECAAVCEIDSSACAVLKARFPTVPNLGDFTKIGVEYVGTIDLLIGGTPCQSFSVAGLRKGLDDPRGNLTLEFLALAKRLKPNWIIWENVPGFLSDNEGETARSFLDIMEELGYVIDIDILDAQFHGVPQRRRRVFVCGQSVTGLLRQKTISSGLTVAQCLIESFQFALHVLYAQLIPESENLESQVGKSVLSLRRRIKLFGMDSEDQASLLLTNLTALLPSLGNMPFVSDSENGNDHSEILGSTKSPRLHEEMENIEEFQSIGMLLSKTLAENLRALNACITSTERREIIQSTIYSFAQTTLLITKLITPSLSYYPPYWSAASSALIAMEAFIDYARSTTSDLFGDMERFQAWSDFLREADGLYESLCDIGILSFDQVLPLSQSLQGHPAPRREAGQRVAGTIKGGSGERGWPDPSDGNGGGLVDVAGTLGGGSGERGWQHHDGAGAFVPIAHTLGTRNTKGTDERGDGSSNLQPVWPAEVASTLDAHFGDKWGLEDQHINSGASHFVPTVVGTMACNTGPNGHDAGNFQSNQGVDSGYVIPTIAFRTNQTSAQGPIHSEEVTDSLAQDHPPAVAFMVEQNTQASLPELPSIRANETPNYAVAYRVHGENSTAMTGDGTARVADPVDVARSLDTCGGYATNQGGNVVKQSMQVRRLTPIECSRLQGIPDDHLTVLYNGKPLADGPKYRLCGNSFAVPCVAWIGKRIQMVEDMK